MDAVKNFLHKSNQEGSTEVCSEIAPEVTQETVNKHVHVESATAVDREKHIHHHQHRVQPVLAEEHLAEQHVTQIAPEVTRERVEKLSAEKEALLAQQHSAIQNTRDFGATTQTQENLGVTASEHVHHHVHETVTPVIQKDTHEHKVIHDVNLIHEKIHEAPIIHETTTLPPVSIEEFRAQTAGGEQVHNHGDSAHQHHYYQGNPQVQDGSSAVGGHHGHHHHQHGHQAHQDTDGNNHKTSVGEKAANAVERKI